MKRLALATVLLVTFAVAPGALAAPHVESDSDVAGTQVHQEIDFLNPKTIHYWFHASNPAGVAPFCVTLQLEQRQAGAWQGVGMSSQTGVTECCPQPDEECFPTATDGYWDLFLYPKGKRLMRKINRGQYRIRGFSSLGPSLALKLK